MRKDAERKLSICKRTREIAAISLYKTLKRMFSSRKKVSEFGFHEEWLREMQKYNSIAKNGWYNPPKNGLGVIFGTDRDCKRLNYKTLRKMEPQGDIELNTDKGIVYVYASPVDIDTYIIGDFAMTFYFGKDPSIIRHLKQCLEIDRKIFSVAKPNMRLSDLQKMSLKIITEDGLSNDVLSVTKPNTQNIIGHTVPATYENWSSNEIISLNESRNSAKDIISKKRNFISNGEKLSIKNGMAITIEPRLINKNDNKIPLSSYHTIALFHSDGTKELLENFNDIFSLTKMNYMLKGGA